MKKLFLFIGLCMLMIPFVFGNNVTEVNGTLSINDFNATVELKDFNLAGTDVNVIVFLLMGLVWISLMFVSILKIPILSVPTGLFGIFLGLMLLPASTGLSLTFIGVNLIIMIAVFIPKK